MWTQKYAPTRKEELGIHPKKIQQVEDALSYMNPVVVLIGPSGCGKETTLRVLCKGRKWDIKEWECPDIDQETNLGEEFLGFLKKSRVMAPATSKAENHVILIKDIPWTLWEYKTGFPQQFNEIIAGTNTFPLYFCVNDNLDLRKFPDTVHVIQFNPVANTIIAKSLDRICKLSGTQLSKPQINEITTSAQGDLRSAVNTMQMGFTSTEGEVRLGLFHTLGKFLYGKRLQEGAKEPAQLLGENRYNRSPLYYDISEVVQGSGTDPHKLVDFCFTNSPLFFQSLHDLSRAQDHLIMPTFQQQNELYGIYHETALRGLCDSNYYPKKPVQRGLFQFVKPHGRDVLRCASERDGVITPSYGPNAMHYKIPIMNRILRASAGTYHALQSIPCEDMKLFIELHDQWNETEMYYEVGKRKRHREEDGEVQLPPQKPLMDDIQDYDSE